MSEIELTDAQGNKAKFTISNVVITPFVAPEPEPVIEIDQFGIKKIYKTKQGGEEFFIDMAAPKNSRFDPKSTITKNLDGSWKCKATQVRMNVFTSTGYDWAKITTYNQLELAKKGFMQGANDWKDVEMTGYVKLNAYSSMDNFAWYARGGKHTNGSTSKGEQGQEGTAYKGDLDFNGRVRWVKELEHTSGYTFPDPYHTTAAGALKGKWVGFKVCMYNTPEGVKFEEYLNYNNDKLTWTSVNSQIDKGSWCDDSGHAGGSRCQIITWGGPIATFRWDNATDVDFKDFSVREIAPLA